VQSQLFQDNRAAMREWESRQWEKAHARAAELAAKVAAREAAGMPDPIASRTQQLLAERRVREAERAARGESDESEQAPSPVGAATSLAASTPRHVPSGATEASVAAELERWPKPPASSHFNCTLKLHDWPLYYDHFDWLDEMAAVYRFADAGEVLRHLVFMANGETVAVKKLIFKVVRCLHCHSGTRAGFIPKKDKCLALFDFQLAW
jgi:hypothetical protein